MRRLLAIASLLALGAAACGSANGFDVATESSLDSGPASVLEQPPAGLAEVLSTAGVTYASARPGDSSTYVFFHFDGQTTWNRVDSTDLYQHRAWIGADGSLNVVGVECTSTGDGGVTNGDGCASAPVRYRRTTADGTRAVDKIIGEIGDSVFAADPADARPLVAIPYPGGTIIEIVDPSTLDSPGFAVRRYSLSNGGALSDQGQAPEAALGGCYSGETTTLVGIAPGDDRRADKVRVGTITDDSGSISWREPVVQSADAAVMTALEQWMSAGPTDGLMREEADLPAGPPVCIADAPVLIADVGTVSNFPDPVFVPRAETNSNGAAPLAFAIGLSSVQTRNGAVVLIDDRVEMIRNDGVVMETAELPTKSMPELGSHWTLLPTDTGVDVLGTTDFETWSRTALEVPPEIGT